MIVRHLEDAKTFGELPFDEQTKSIAATLDHLHALIEQHIEHSPRRQETINECLSQMDRLRRRLLATYGQEGARSAPEQAAIGVSTAESPKTLDQLLEGVNESNLHHEFDTGPAVGEEVW